MQWDARTSLTTSCISAACSPIWTGARQQTSICSRLVFTVVCMWFRSKSTRIIWEHVPTKAIQLLMMNNGRKNESKPQSRKKITMIQISAPVGINLGAILFRTLMAELNSAFLMNKEVSMANKKTKGVILLRNKHQFNKKLKKTTLSIFLSMETITKTSVAKWIEKMFKVKEKLKPQAMFLQI